jgi:capsule polysaccharide export protein KpsE/RkpR
MEATESAVGHLSILMKTWISTEEELRTLSAEIREKRKHSLTIRSQIVTIMKELKIGRLNISAGSVTTRVRNTKAPMTKKYLINTLAQYFQGDMEKARQCAAFLDEQRPLVQKENLALDPYQPPSPPHSVSH